MNEIYAVLKPFGYIPGNQDKRCMDCGLVYALMDSEATRCKRCARKILKESEIK